MPRPLLLSLLLGFAAGTCAHAQFIASSDPVANALQPFVDSHSLAGAVTVVATKDRILSLDAIGYQDVAAARPMAKNSLFWIASQSKPMTAVVFMTLVEEGKVSPADTVEKYLPEFHSVMVGAGPAAHPPSHPLLIRELLSHTAGLAFSAPGEGPPFDRLTLRERVKLYAKTPLLCDPGTAFHYSNAGLNTVARIMEIVSQTPYEKLMEERLFQPLGMIDTTFWPTSAQLARLAKSYQANPAKTGLDETSIGQLSYPLESRTRKPLPAGGLFSTGADVARFCQMIASGGAYNARRILSEKSVQEMTSKQTGSQVPDGYGFGWMTAGPRLGHSGAYNTDMNIDRQNGGLITVYLVQQSGGYPNDGGRVVQAFNDAAKTLPR